MKVVTPGVYCLIFDTTAGNFLNMSEIISLPAEDEQSADEAHAGGGS
jgi:hypothetical protein